MTRCFARAALALLSLGFIGGAALSCSRAGGTAPSAAADAPGTATVQINPVDGGAQRAAPVEPSAEADACVRIEGQRYKSRDKQECGPPEEDGTVSRCHWRLRFSKGEYEWQYTDMLMNGKYACEGLTIRETAPEAHSGRLDPRTGHVFWEGVEYVPDRQ
jgi:hypothetical protein